ncbi:MAG: peptidoglycan -binding protein [Planktomarina sp.]
MALVRRSGARFQASIWPGFVDAMTGLLLVLMFVLTIFMVMQFVLRETIKGQGADLQNLNAQVDQKDAELAALAAQISQLGDALGVERNVNANLRSDLANAEGQIAEQTTLIGRLSAQVDTQTGQIADFETQVASLLAQRREANAQIAGLEDQATTLTQELVAARDEIDAQIEAARLAAAQRELLERTIAGLQDDVAATKAQLDETQTALSEEEAAKLTQMAAVRALQEDLANSNNSLTAITLALDAERKRAEETLSLLAAAQAAEQDLDARLKDAALALAASEAAQKLTAEELAALQDQSDTLTKDLAAALAAKALAESNAADTMSDADRKAALLAQAEAELANAQSISTQAQRDVAQLSLQIKALQDELAILGGLLDASEARQADSNATIDSLGTRLNAALAEAALQARKAQALEEAETQRLTAEAERLAAEAETLEQYKSEFLGQMRTLLEGRDGVRLVGDRFVFSSEILFPPGQADLSTAGKAEIAKIVDLLNGVITEIPPQIDWVLQVDGHTDNIPLSSGRAFANNWELSQARALSVVLYLAEDLGFPPGRLSANGFGEYQPLDPANTAAARAQNRRIELKFTEK